MVFRSLISTNKPDPPYLLLITRYITNYSLYSKSKSFIQICRGSARVPTPHQSGQPRGDCPYLNCTNHLDALYQVWLIIK